MVKILLFMTAAVMVAFAAGADEPEVIKCAIARLDGSGVTGNVTFTHLDDGKVRITGTIVGMPPGLNGFHVHEKGDITNGCGSTLAHFNPNGNDHGHPQDENRHVGDLGNIEFDQSGVAHIDFVDHQIKLNGRHSIVGRGLVLHEKADDFGKTDHPDSKKTGNAGGRVACGVIGILDSEPGTSSAATTSLANVLVLITVYHLIAVWLR